MKFFDDLREFYYANNIAATAAAFSIGGITVDLVKSIVDSAIFPIFAVAVGSDRYVFNLMFVFRMFFTWILILFTAFIFINYVFLRGILGLKPVLTEDKKQELEKAKKSAQEESIINPWASGENDGMSSFEFSVPSS